jgi:hypothetical protein
MAYSNLTFTVNTNLSFVANDFVQLSANSTNYIIGRVVSYNPSTGALIITPLESVGSGSYSSWTVALTGFYGTSGTSGTAGTMGSSATSGLSNSSTVAGSSGTSASSGSSGIAGSNGTSGASASSGSSGLAGANGATGPQGPIGPTGAQGPQGARGTSGSSGVNGGTGPQGPIGAQGPKGPTGASPQGPTGPTGPQGPSNTNGQSLNSGDSPTFATITANGQVYSSNNIRNNGGVRGMYVNGYGIYFYNNTSSQWYSNGGIGAGGGNFFVASTSELKTNIQPFTKSALEIINDTDIVSFEFEITGLEGHKHIGFIAEDTREELATKKHDQMVVPTSLGILLKAVQELDEKLKIIENNT